MTLVFSMFIDLTSSAACRRRRQKLCVFHELRKIDRIGGTRSGDRMGTRYLCLLHTFRDR